MATKSRHPDLTTRYAATHFLRISRKDWPKLRVGEKREIRFAGRFAKFGPRPFPLVAVAYSFTTFNVDPKTMLLVVEAERREPLGAISAEGIHAEGYETLREFKHYWRERHTRVGFRPLTNVQVLTVRPFRAADRIPMADLVFEHLYGPWCR